MQLCIGWEERSPRGKGHLREGHVPDIRCTMDSSSLGTRNHCFTVMTLLIRSDAGYHQITCHCMFFCNFSHFIVFICACFVVLNSKCEWSVGRAGDWSSDFLIKL